MIQLFTVRSKDIRSHRIALTLIELIVVLAILVGLAGVVIPVFSNSVDSAEASTTEASLVVVRDAMIQYWSDTKYVELTGVPNGATDTDTSNPSNTTNRFQIRWLFLNPEDGTTTVDVERYRTSRIGWNGPYLVESTIPFSAYAVDDDAGFSDVYGSDGDPAIWGGVRSHRTVISGVTTIVPRPLVVQAIDLGNGLIDCRVVSAGENDQIDIAPDALTSTLTEDNTEDDLYVSFTLRR